MTPPAGRLPDRGVVLVTAPRGSDSRLAALEDAAAGRAVVRVDARVGEPPWAGLERLVPGGAGRDAGTLRRHLAAARSRPEADRHRSQTLLAVDLAACWTTGASPVLDGLDAATPEVAAVVGQALLRLARVGGHAVVGATTPGPGETVTPAAAVVAALAVDPAVTHVRPVPSVTAAPTGDLAAAVVADLVRLAAGGPLPRRWVAAVAGRRGAPPEVAARMLDDALADGRLTGDDVLVAPGIAPVPGDDRADLAWAVLVERRHDLAAEAPAELLALLADVAGPDTDHDTLALLVDGAEAATWTDPALATRLLDGARRAAPAPEAVGTAGPDRLAAPLVRLLRRHGDWDRAATLGRAAAATGDLAADVPTLVDWSTALLHVGAADEAVRALRRAVRVPGRPTGQRSLLRRQLARALAVEGSHPEALAVLAAEDAPDVGDRDRGAARAGRVLLAMSAGTGDEVVAARRAARASHLPMPGLADDRLFRRAWDGAAVLDMAAAEAALLGRVMGDQRGTPLPWRDVRAAYDRGAWDDVVALADLLRSDDTAPDALADYEAARVQVTAAAVALARGDAPAAAARLAGVPDPMVCGAAADAVRTGVAAALGRRSDALALAHRALDRLAAEGVTQGEDLVRAAVVDVLTGAPGTGQSDAPGRPVAGTAGGDLDAALAAAEAAADRVGSERAAVLALRARATVRGDAGAGRAAVELASRRDDRFDLARAAFAAGVAGDDPESRLRAAHETFRDLGADPWRRAVVAAMRARRLPVPRRRPGRATDDELDRLVRRGLGNRELAHHLGVADRTVEARVAALLAASGSSSRIRHLASPPRELTDPADPALPPVPAAVPDPVVTVPARPPGPDEWAAARAAVAGQLPALRAWLAVETRRAHLSQVLAEAREPYRARV